MRVLSELILPRFSRGLKERGNLAHQLFISSMTGINPIRECQLSEETGATKKEKKPDESVARLFQIHNRGMDQREKLIRHLFCEEREERGEPSREKHHNRWQPDAAVPGSPQHDVARWATQ